VLSSGSDAGYWRAYAIVILALDELVLDVRTLALQLFGDERAATPVAFTGGMLTKGTTLRKRLEHRLKSAVPGAQVRAGEVNPARGAVRSALRYVGETIAES
jgi:glucosamine kinase